MISLSRNNLCLHLQIVFPIFFYVIFKNWNHRQWFVSPTSLLTILWEPPQLMGWSSVSLVWCSGIFITGLDVPHTKFTLSQSDSEQLLWGCVMLLCFFPSLLSQRRMFSISAHANKLVPGRPAMERASWKNSSVLTFTPHLMVTA